MPGYNFKKAFYGKANKKASATVNKDFRRAVGKGYGAAKKYANNYISTALSGQGDYGVGYKKKYISGKKLSTGHTVGAHGFISSGSRVHFNQKELAEKGEMTLTHSEYIGELISSGTTGTTNFTSQTYGINPGNVGLFPYLSNIANSFQMYEFEKLVIEYRPLISESTSTSSATLTSMGQVVMATQYDSASPIYPNVQQMSNSDYSCSGRPSVPLMMAIECKPKYNPLGVMYVSSNTNPLGSGVSNADVRMQNLGFIQIASSNIPIASSTALDLGSLYVHYKVKLLKPIEGFYSSLLSGHWVNNTATGVPVTTTPFGASVSATVQPTAKSGTSLGCTFSASGVVTFPLAITQGTYIIQYVCIGSAATIGTAGWTAPLNCTLLSMFNNDATNSVEAPNATVTLTSSFACVAVVSINAPGASLASVQLSTLVIPTAGNFDLIITPFNSTIIT